jgi:hypothetical protein
MPVLIDGNNLLHSLPTAHRNRADVRQHALEQVRHEALQVFLVFDGPPPDGSPVMEHLGRVTVQYSGAVTADDVIIGLVPGGRSASQWVVVTDDRALRNRARSKGASVRTLAEWRGRRRPRKRRSAFESKLSSRDIADWESYFSTPSESEES